MIFSYRQITLSYVVYDELGWEMIALAAVNSHGCKYRLTMVIFTVN